MTPRPPNYPANFRAAEAENAKRIAQARRIAAEGRDAVAAARAGGKRIGLVAACNSTAAATAARRENAARGG